MKEGVKYVHRDGVGGGFFLHDDKIEPHHNDRGSCAICLSPIKKVKA